jgi:hypothetical protein
MMEIAFLEELARDRVYQFAFFGAPPAPARRDRLATPPLGDAVAQVSRARGGLTVGRRHPHGRLMDSLSVTISEHGRRR